MARLDLAGVDQALAIEAEPTPLFRLAKEAVAILKIVEDAVEHRGARCTRRKHDQLQRGRDRLTGRVQWQTKVSAQVVRSGDQGRGLFCDVTRRNDSRSGLDHCKDRLGNNISDTLDEVARNGAWNHHKVRFRPRNGIEVECMPLRSDRVYPD